MDEPATPGAEPGPTASEAAAARAVGELDTELARAAQAKRLAGGKLTREEQSALRRLDRAREEARRWEYYRSIPQRHWREMSGRQAKVLAEQAQRYGIPFAGRTIDLAAVVRSLHDFLAANRHRLAGGEAGGGEASELERWRSARAELAQLEVEERAGRLVDRDQLRERWALVAASIRRAGDALLREHGEDAQQLLEDALADAERRVAASLGELPPPAAPRKPPKPKAPKRRKRKASGRSSGKGKPPAASKSRSSGRSRSGKGGKS